MSCFLQDHAKHRAGAGGSSASSVFWGAPTGTPFYNDLSDCHKELVISQVSPSDHKGKASFAMQPRTMKPAVDGPFEMETFGNVFGHSEQRPHIQPGGDATGT